jgi:hypothetical protein
MTAQGRIDIAPSDLSSAIHGSVNYRRIAQASERSRRQTQAALRRDRERIADLADPMLKDRIAELKAIRDQARVDAERAEDAIERVGPSNPPAGAQNIRQASLQTDANRERRLPPRPPARARPARRGRCERGSYHGVEKRTAAHARRRVERENGGFWRSQFCTEVARPTGLEPVFPP